MKLLRKKKITVNLLLESLLKWVPWFAVYLLHSSAANSCIHANASTFWLRPSAFGRRSVQSVAARALQVASDASRGVILRLRRRVSEPGAGQRRQQSLHLVLAGPPKPAEPELRQSVQLPQHPHAAGVRAARPSMVHTRPLAPVLLTTRMTLSVGSKAESACTVWPCEMSSDTARSCRWKNIRSVHFIFLYSAIVSSGNVSGTHWLILPTALYAKSENIIEQPKLKRQNLRWLL